MPKSGDASLAEDDYESTTVHLGALLSTSLYQDLLLTLLTNEVTAPILKQNGVSTSATKKRGILTAVDIEHKKLRKLESSAAKDEHFLGIWEVVVEKATPPPSGETENVRGDQRRSSAQGAAFQS
jgi:hypothetical protein